MPEGIIGKCQTADLPTLSSKPNVLPCGHCSSQFPHFEINIPQLLYALHMIIYINGYMSHVMRKLTFCICKNKGTDQINLISSFVFAKRIVQFLHLLNPKFPVSSHLLCLYRLVCVEPVQKPSCYYFIQTHAADLLQHLNEYANSIFKHVKKKKKEKKKRHLDGISGQHLIYYLIVKVHVVEYLIFF